MLRGLWNLFRLGCTTGFKLNGPYWTWRKETAFGTGTGSVRIPSAAERRHAAIEYGEWVGQMRALRRAGPAREISARGISASETPAREPSARADTQ